MPKTSESTKPLSAAEVASLAENCEDISRFFSNKGRMMPPIAPDAKEDGDGQEP
jgi:hypothetical protein